MNKNKKINIYIFISGIMFVIFMCCLMFNSQVFSRWIVMEKNFDWQFSDFFRHIVYSSDLKNIYFNSMDAVFPPLAYIFYHMLWKLNPVYLSVELLSWNTSMLYQFNLLIFLMYNIVIILLLSYVLNRLLKVNFKGNIFLLLIIFSASFMFGAIERGNCAILVLTLVLYALYFKDSDNKYLREIALILIAVAASFKMYPAVFGLMYIKEKRFNEAFRLIIYGVLFFFIPFLFTGGLDGFKQYLNIVGNAKGAVDIRWTNIRGVFYCILNMFHIDYLHYDNFGKIIENIYLILAVIGFFKCKTKWKSIYFLSSIMSVYVFNSYRYTSIYMLIPFIYFIIDESKEKVYDYMYLILFSLIFVIPIYGFNMDVEFLIFTPIYLIAMLILVEKVISNIKNKTQKIGIKPVKNY